MLDTSIVATCLYSIAAEFQSRKSINWVALSYTLSYLGFAVFFARISDLVGRKAALMCSFTIFIVFSMVCGFARSLTKLVVFRAFQGIGGSGLYSLAIITLPELTPMEQKKHVATIIGIVIASSGIMGPLLGGLLSQWPSWEVVFWIKYVPLLTTGHTCVDPVLTDRLTCSCSGTIGTVAAVAFWLGWPVHIPDIKRRTWTEVDPISPLLLIAGSVLIVFSIQSAGLDSSSAPWRARIFWAPSHVVR